MRLTLTHKLFGLLAATALLAIGGTTGVFVLQLERGFVAYLDEIDRDYVQKLVDVAAKQYQSDGNFEKFRKGGWKNAHAEAFGEQPKSDLTARYMPAAPRPDEPPRKGPPEGRRESAKRHDAPFPGYGPANPGKAPDVKDAPRANDPFNVSPRTQLVTPRGELIGGRPPAAAAVLRQFPVTVNGETVAFVQLAGRPNSLSGREAEHLRAVQHRILAVAVAVMAVALLLAYWVSSRWTRRLQGVIDVTEQVAKGEFTARTSASGSDEIGQLAAHVNEMARSLDKLEGSRRRWLADVAHELRTPLATLQGEIEGLIDGVFEVDDDALKSLHEEVRHLTRLTGDLHQLALSDLGALPIYPELTDVSEIVTRAVQRWQVSAQRLNLSLTRDSARATFAMVDETRITQVIDNLLQNSLRYTDKGGTVALAVEPTQDAVVISVDDTPPGVKAEDLERMFDPLFRGDEARSRERGGSGLGLALARAIVDAHKGSIIAKSSKLGGLRVEVMLPTSAFA